MPPVSRDEEPIDIVARPVNPDGTIGQPESDAESGPDIMHLASPRRRDGGGSGREEVRYWRFEGAGDDGCGCSGCGCLSAIVLLLLMFLLKACGI